MYIGELIEATPMATPPKRRKKTKTPTLLGERCQSREEKERTGQEEHFLAAQRVAQESGDGRPGRAAQQDAGRGQPFSKAGSSLKCVVRNPMAPEITAVS
jgi:hypothetical protein